MSGCEVIIEAMNIKNTFYVIICDVLSISYVKMKLSQIILNLQNGRHFEVQAIFKSGSCTKIDHAHGVRAFWILEVQFGSCGYIGILLVSK